jgi:hypothetical protein
MYSWHLLRIGARQRWPELPTRGVSLSSAAATVLATASPYSLLGVPLQVADVVRGGARQRHGCDTDQWQRLRTGVLTAPGNRFFASFAVALVPTLALEFGYGFRRGSSRLNGVLFRKPKRF